MPNQEQALSVLRQSDPLATIACLYPQAFALAAQRDSRTGRALQTWGGPDLPASYPLTVETSSAVGLHPIAKIPPPTNVSPSRSVYHEAKQFPEPLPRGNLPIPAEAKNSPVTG